MNHRETVTAIRDIVIEQYFDAPPSLVFKNWIDPDLVSRWFAADTFKVTAATLDVRPGGAWRVDFRRDSGWTYFEFGTFQEIVPPSRLVFTLTHQHGENKGPETLITVSFAQEGKSTLMTFRQSGFDDAARRDANAEGWGECIRKLSESLAEQEIEREAGKEAFDPQP
ncbi:SRPBCC domain-containing protein [Rhizobium sp. TH2]|uniref:SRPBCC family protein n=1 Tax=Rhizobium sp. TH2 TaxID=2775403 RepID=UPI002157DF64|nr:SRPBCC domain-containing protein [Rhizobium sp. TH2]UVC11488.1 SRPBCC domain-containing protein [Rhizobium sp. TH2]